MHPLTDVTLLEGITYGAPILLPLLFWGLLETAVALADAWERRR